MNYYDFAKLKNANDFGYEFEFAPPTLVEEDGTVIENPTKDDYNRFGFKEILNVKPKEKDGYYITLKTYEELEDSIAAVYEYVEIIPPPIIISKYKLIKKLMEMNLWTQVKQMLESNGLLDLFNSAQELNSEDDFFKQGIQLAKTELGMTDEQIQQFIEQVVS